MRLYWLVSSAFFLVACGNSGTSTNSTPETISDLASEPAGNNCEFGGLSLSTGSDDNEDGALDESEINSVDYLCDDEPGTPPETSELLTDLAVEAPGANCEFGGVSLSTGTDDNEDGVLNESEVNSVDYLCDDEPGTPPETADFLTDLALESPGANCEFGGVSLSTGTDDNEDGVLDESEVNSVDYLCDDEPGAPPETTDFLTDLALESPGANCEFGGVSLSTGTDDNEDGVLDESEVDDVDYVCEDAPAPELPILTHFAVEAPGNNCEFGGVSLSAGLDDNEDGALDDGEVDDISYLCDNETAEPNRIVPGDLVITSFFELDTFQQYTEVQGNLTIDGAALSNFNTLELPNLSVVGGTLSIVNFAGIESIALPALVEAQEIRLLNLPNISSFSDDSIPNLSGSQNFTFENLQNLSQVSLPNITIAGLFRFTTLPQLTSIDLSGLTDAFGIFFNDASAVNSVQLGGTAFTDSFYYENSNGSNAIAVSGVSSIARDLVIRNASLTSFTMDGAFSVGTRVEFSNLANANSINVGATSIGGDFGFITLPVLNEVIFQNLTSVGRHLQIGQVQNDVSIAFPLLEEIVGEFLVASSTLGDLTFAALTRVQDGIVVFRSTVNTLNLSELEILEKLNGDALSVRESTLQSIDLSGATSATQTVRFFNSTISELNFNALQSFSPDGVFTIDLVSGLTSFSAPALATGRDLFIQRNPTLTTLSLPALSNVNGFFVRNNSSLPCSEVEAALTGVTSNGVSIFGNGGANCVAP